jgi:hypothetical protein
MEPYSSIRQNEAPKLKVATLGNYRVLDTPEPQRANLWRLRLVRVGWKYSPSRSMKGCCRRVIDAEKPVVYEATSSSVTMANISYCRSWACPWCAGKRGKDLAEILGAGISEAKKKDYWVKFVTLTIPTDVWSFDYQLKVLRDAFKSFRKRVNRHISHHYGVKTGFSYSFDFTIRRGVSKGTGKRFQPHLHIHAIALAEAKLENVEFDFSRAWQECVDKAHGKSVRLYAQACRIDDVKADKGVSAYVYKWLGSASELMKGQNKSGKLGRSMSFHELVKFIDDTDDERAIQVYQEVLVAMKGKHFSSVGRVMKRLANEAEPEPDDQGDELVEEVPRRLELHWMSHTAIVSIAGALEFVMKALQMNDVAKMKLFEATNKQSAAMYRANLYSNDQIRKIWVESLSKSGLSTARLTS